MSKKLKPQSDYILIVPDKPKGGAFDVGDNYIDETGVIEDCGPNVSNGIQALKGKRIIFNAWACDQKVVQGQKYYFATESANAVCALT
jgi:hypothetical protein